jgi:hypothetical protein
VNPNKSILKNIAKQKAKRASIPKTYMQKQYERADAEASKIKNHNEQLLKNLKNNTND